MVRQEKAWWFGEALESFLVLSQRVLGRLGAPRWIPVTLVVAAFYVLAIMIFLVVSIPHGDISDTVFSALTAFFGLLAVFAAWDTLRRQKSFGEKFLETAEELGDFLGLPARAGDVRFFVAAQEARHRPREGVAYNVESHARADVEALIHLAHWAASRNLADRGLEFDPEQMLISAESAGRFRQGALIYVGGPLTHPAISAFVADDPHIWYQDVSERGDGTNAIVCKDAALGAFATVPPRDDISVAYAKNQSTYGCVMRRQESDSRRVFAVWGLDARGTLGAALWLISSWDRLKARYAIDHRDDFTAVVRVLPAGVRTCDPVRVPGAEPALLLPSSLRAKAHR